MISERDAERLRARFGERMSPTSADDPVAVARRLRRFGYAATDAEVELALTLLRDARVEPGGKLATAEPAPAEEPAATGATGEPAVPPKAATKDRSRKKGDS